MFLQQFKIFNRKILHIAHPVHNCIRCFKFTAKAESHIMGNLPECCLVPTRHILNTGLDYAGPFIMKDRATKYFKPVKRYVALFMSLYQGTTFRSSQ